MNSKAIAGIVAVIVVVAAVAIVLSLDKGGNDDQGPGQDAVIIYDGNGGTYNGSSTYKSASNKVSTYGFTNGDLHLIGWNTAKDGSGTYYSSGSTIESASASNPVTLYAQWSYILYNDSITTVPSIMSDIVIFVLDGDEPVLVVDPAKHNSIAMPENPKFVVMSEDNRWTWELQDNHFYGTDAAGNKVVLRIGLYGDDIQSQCSIVDNTPTVEFSGLGDVLFSLFYSRQ